MTVLVDPHRTVKATRNRIEGGMGGADIAQPGEIMPRSILQDGQLQHVGYAICCPGCGQEAWIPTTPADDGWVETGDLDAGTLSLTPSLAQRCCGWHGHLTNGQFIPVGGGS